MAYRPIVVVVVLALLAVVAAPPHQTRQVNAEVTARDKITLKDTLNTGLKSRRKQEFAFIDRIVQLVDSRKLPLPIVLGIFKKAKTKRHPFQYFEEAMRREAKRRKVTI